MLKAHKKMHLSCFQFYYVYVPRYLGIYRLARILWIFNLRNAVCRLCKFPDCTEHIHSRITILTLIFLNSEKYLFLQPFNGNQNKQKILKPRCSVNQSDFTHGYETSEVMSDIVSVLSRVKAVSRPLSFLMPLSVLSF